MTKPFVSLLKPPEVNKIRPVLFFVWIRPSSSPNNLFVLVFLSVTIVDHKRSAA